MDRHTDNEKINIETLPMTDIVPSTVTANQTAGQELNGKDTNVMPLDQFPEKLNPTNPEYNKSRWLYIREKAAQYRAEIMHKIENDIHSQIQGFTYGGASAKADIEALEIVFEELSSREYKVNYMTDTNTSPATTWIQVHYKTEIDTKMIKHVLLY